MSSIIIPRKWTAQPQYPVEIDWSNPLARGLKFGWSAGSRIDLVRRIIPSVNSPIGATHKGLAAIGDSTNYVQFANLPVVVTTSYSVFSLIRLTTTSEFYIVANEAAYTNQWRVSGYQSGGNLRINAPGGSDSNTGARTVNGDVFSIGVSCDSGVTDGLKYYRGGQATNVLTGTAPTLSGSKPISIMRKNYTETAGPSGMDTVLVLMWDRPLSDAEQLALEQNPWQLSRKQPQVLYFDVGGGGTTLTPSLYVDGDTFHAATVSAGALTLTPSLYSDGDTFHAATVTLGGAAQDLTPALFADGDTFHSATVAAGSVNLAPSLVTDGDTFHAATVAPGSVTLTPSLVSDGDTFYTHALVLEGGPQTLSPELFADGDTFHAATVTPGAVTLTASLYTDADTFHAAEIASGFNLQPPAYADPDTFYPATVAAGAVSLTPDLFVDGDAFHAPTVSLAGTQMLTPDLFADADTFYVPTITGGTVTLGAARSAGRQIQTGARSNIQTNRR